MWKTRIPYLVPLFPKTPRNHQISHICVDNVESVPGTYVTTKFCPFVWTTRNRYLVPIYSALKRRFLWKMWQSFLVPMIH